MLYFFPLSLCLSNKFQMSSTHRVLFSVCFLSEGKGMKLNSCYNAKVIEFEVEIHVELCNMFAIFITFPFFSFSPQTFQNFLPFLFIFLILSSSLYQIQMYMKERRAWDEFTYVIYALNYVCNVWQNSNGTLEEKKSNKMKFASFFSFLFVFQIFITFFKIKLRGTETTNIKWVERKNFFSFFLATKRNNLKF